jgi:protein O-mannosyl-transferase
VNIAKPYLLLLIVFCVLGTYYPTIFATFNSVDDVNMINSLLNTESVNLVQLFVPHSGGAYYRPLLYLTFILDGYLWGFQASFMHLENILLHGLNAVFVFLISARLFTHFKLASPFAALFAALLFALHPINTEAVNWISGRTDVMAGSFLLLSLYLLVLSVARPAKVLMPFVGLAFFLACLCKDSAVFALPGFCLLTVVLGGGARGMTPGTRVIATIRTYVYPVAILCSSAVAYFILRRHALSAGDSGVGSVIKIVSGSETGVYDTGRVLSKVFGFYVKKLFVPWPLNFTIVHVPDYYAIVGIGAVLVLGCVLWRNRLAGACLLFSCCMIAPALLVPLGKFAWTPVAERYLYMATPTFCIALVLIGLLLKPLRINTRLVTVAAGCIVAVLVVSTSARNRIWQSNLTLFEDSVKKTPDFMPGRNELALALMEAGRIHEAQEIIMSNSLPNDNKFSIITNLGKATVLKNRGQLREAKKLLYSSSYAPSNPLYVRYAETVIGINENLIAEPLTSAAEAQALNIEIITLLMDLQKTTSDPFYYYRIGQRYLKAKNIVAAQKYFQLASVHAPAHAHYRTAAQRLSEKLKP